MFPIMNESPFNSNSYSLNLNGVHFLTFTNEIFSLIDINKKSSSNNNNNNNSSQSPESSIESLFKWIENDLKKANQNRHLVPWIIVFNPSKLIECLELVCNLTRINNFKKK
jgi:hypothetical protein